MKKERLDILVTERGLAETRTKAQALIMSGMIYVNGSKEDKSGTKFPEDAVIELHGEKLPYVSRGGLKLEKALQVFDTTPSEKICMDVGASTGGFTDCMLQNGAAKVYAVDVGYGQFSWKLRQDEHVVNLEKTNISDEKLLALSPRPDLGTVDVSYLSLRKAIPYFAAVLHGAGELCCLVKPLFEIDDAEARRTGVIADDRYAPLLRSLIDDVNAMPGAAVRAVTHSSVTGNAGTREFFLHVVLGEACGPIPEEAIAAAVERARALEQYKKT